MSELEHHDRRRRDLFEDWAIKLESPSVKWQKILGSKKIGASFGLTIKNMLDIKIGGWWCCCDVVVVVVVSLLLMLWIV